ncbi:tetracycline resistance MFS efflux pump [Sinorhizobium meliloti]|uniref:TCR/Tet family MFS transporter n=1 Tax=Rhizobium meliloti TaxID=382 RepID=UPI0002A55A7C|nr:tetracycline resistance MFS efflux pump [Sinorhizobium meliloti]AGA06551.1 Arabinose efflux permease [Sinorhizobium meliloti GR4]MQW56366.1 tetracycline resistance MFS efflux pump [Sinorhizobium meliloti]MQX38937.1 tetracycline resistance MFS efflux pump [Sinorhizobium meliloti]MQX74448.1 tetracycline resistance MFS efflux pump [Sinorhizobium meliloti]MQX88978.1 tetracycline resistance MFS efflux pump [Sinorhizobium meliloti]
MLDKKFVRRGLFLVFLILFLDIMGIAIIVPVLPTYLEELTGADIGEAAVDGGWLLLVYSAMQFLFAPLIGNLSDRFGRRPVLLASVLTFALDNLICALATSYWMLFIGRSLAGISGASFGTASAYIADVSDDENRAKNFGLIGIAFGTGFALGPVIGGFLGELGPRVPFYGAAALSFLNFIMGVFLLPETLAPANRRRFEWHRANPLGALKQMRHYPGIGWVGLVFFLYWLAHAVYPAVWSFVGSYRYGWSEGQIGLSLGIFGVGGAIVMALVLPRVVAALGERRTAALGLTFTALGMAGYAAAWEGWMVYAVIVATALESLADPPLRSIASVHVPPSAQGELQGALTSISSITTILGPLMFTQIFAFFTDPAAAHSFAGAPYALAGCLIVAALVIFLAKVGAGRGGAVRGAVRA